MLNLLNRIVDEYSATYTIGNTGLTNPRYSKRTSYNVRLESVNRELIEREYGLREDIAFRMYSVAKPTLGNFILIDKQYYRIRLVNFFEGKSLNHHYESLLERI